MRRVHLFEWEDMRWFPAVWRNLLTDYMSYCNSLINPYAFIMPRIYEALDKLGCAQILDLCSGGGGHWSEIYLQLTEEYGRSVGVTLTDKFPSESGQKRVRRINRSGLQYLTTSVDALAVKEGNNCLRTLFTSFHHFRPQQAREILADSVRNRVGIGIFETTERSLFGLVAGFIAPVVMLAVTPWIRPFSWKRLLWTYVLPVIPVFVLWDGVISALRTYTVDEMKAMTISLGSNDYQWEIAKFYKRAGANGTYLLGYPRNATDDSGAGGKKI